MVKRDRAVQRQAALAQFRKQMRVFFFQIGVQIHQSGHVTVLCRTQTERGAVRGNTGRWMRWRTPGHLRNIGLCRLAIR